eukprot:m.526205 g.526205  ORF g.526205 m.526205 type:complete len:133 (+) comp22001_c0_seq29:292-690(+)
MDVDEMPSLRFGLVAAEMGVESHDDERSDNESCLSDPSDPYQGDTTEPFAPDYGDLDDYADDFDEGHTERSHQENYTEDEVDADGIDDGGFDVVSPRAPSARSTYCSLSQMLQFQLALKVITACFCLKLHVM